MLDVSYKVKKNEDLVCRTLDEDIFVVHLKTGVCYVLSSTARLIWELLGGDSLSIADIIRFVRESFQEDEKNNISSDVQAFIKDLRSNDLVCLSKPAMADKTQVSSLSASANRDGKNRKIKGAYLTPELIRVKPPVQKREGHSVKCQTQRSPCATSAWCQ